MFGPRRQAIQQLEQPISVPYSRTQRLEAEQAALLARLEGERQFRLLTGHITAAAQTALVLGAAIERFAEAMRSPLPPPPRGRAGGRARARTAWRYLDGTFMPESEKDAVYLEEYEHYAAGGRRRAATAVRARDGPFLSRALVE